MSIRDTLTLTINPVEENFAPLLKGNDDAQLLLASPECSYFFSLSVG